MMRLSLEDTPKLKSFEDATRILSAISAHPDDSACDKWLYQLIGRAVESGVASAGALLLASALKERLQRRSDAGSFTTVALGAGASVNATRLALDGVIMTPCKKSGETLAAKGAWGVQAIRALLRVMAADRCEAKQISPRNYANTLRTALLKGASAMESADPELSDVSWACRRKAVEVLTALEPMDVDIATSEALRALLVRSKRKTTSSWFAVLEDDLKPWRATPFITFEWFVRWAVSLEAAGRDRAAARVRCRGRARVGNWPLLQGILYCADCQSIQDPAWVLVEAARCYRSALSGVQTQYNSAAWRRAWAMLARAPDVFGQCRDRTTCGDSPAETVLLILGDVLTHCQWRNNSEKRSADSRQADAYWCAATLAVKRGAMSEAEERCKLAEKTSSLQRAAAGYAATGIVALRRATSIDALHTAKVLLECATLSPNSGAVPWAGLTDCLHHLGQGADAAAAAGQAARFCDADSVHDVAACYLRTVMHIENFTSSVGLLGYSGTPHVADILCEQLRVCEVGSSVASLISAAEEIVIWGVVSVSLALSRASITLVRHGAFDVATALAHHCLNAPIYDAQSRAIAHCSLARVANSRKITFAKGKQEAFALSALKALPDQSPTGLKHLASAVVILRAAFEAVENVVCQVQTCDLLAALFPHLHDPVNAFSTTIGVHSGLLDADLASSNLQCNHPDLSRCVAGGLAFVEARHYSLRRDSKIGGSMNQAYLAIAFDEARANHKPCAAAEIAFEIFDAHSSFGDLTSALNAVGGLELLLRVPRCDSKHRMLVDDSKQSKLVTRGMLWLFLGRTWLTQGCRTRASKYLQRATSLQACDVSREAVDLELRMASSLKNWGWAATALNVPGDDVGMCFPENIRCFYHVLEEGDLLRRQGNLKGAETCYVSASQVLKITRESVNASLHEHLVACIHQSAAQGIVKSSGICLFLGAFSMNSQSFQLILSRGARLADLRGSEIHALTSYRATLRAQPYIKVNCACLWYRLARKLFGLAHHNAAAACEVMHLLCRTFVSAWRACQWKLAMKSARALAVATLHFVPGAVSSPLVALLAHASLGRSHVAADDPASFLRRAMACIDNLLIQLLEVFDVDARDRCGRSFANLDEILSNLPEAYSIVAVLVSPTGHLLISRIQRGQRPITLCAALPQGWHDPNNQASVVGFCRRVLMACTAGLRMHLPQGPRGTHVESTLITGARKIWWCQRHSLDFALGQALSTFDQAWLGAMRALLATAPVSALAKIPAESPGVLQLCIYAVPHITRAETGALLRASARGVVDTSTRQRLDLGLPCTNVTAHVLRLWVAHIGALGVFDLKSILYDLGFCTLGLKSELVTRLSKVLQMSALAPCCVQQGIGPTMERQPLILALDKQLQCLPIEDLAVPRAAPTSRVPSLAFALSLAARASLAGASHMTINILMRGCCVIDPEANLPATRHKLKEYFERIKHNASIEWSCAALGREISVKDTTSHLTKAMPRCAAFLFCGHGHGAAYSETAVNSNCMAAMLLMGCSSGRLSQEGDFEPRGVALGMLAKGVPIVVAMLWDITDRDADRMTVNLLQSMAKHPNQPIPDLLNAAREQTKLRRLNGAAPVCYGLPVSLSTIENSRHVSLHGQTSYF
mmetsp:Transcript_31992/g.98727  ORF Transcript_31992/g.98727 Transcript_31992/m.98727 type:complete len:1622 (-) Transcript_31992:999-5864(-)